MDGCPEREIRAMNNRIRDEVRWYAGRTSGRGAKDMPEEIAKSRKFLDTFTEKDPCYEAAHTLHFYYALIAQSAYAKPYHSPSPYGMQWSMDLRTLSDLFLSLAKADAIRTLRPSLREAWGGVWKERDPSGRFRILGAYDCLTGKIYIEPTLAPWNLAAVIAHEADHIFRDKLGYEDAPEAYFRDGVPEALLYDETLAAMHAGFTQLQLQRDKNRKRVSSVGNLRGILLRPAGTGWSLDINRGTYVLPRDEGDLDLYRERGGLFQLWKKVVKSVGLATGELFQVFLRKVSDLAPKATLPILDRILMTLQKGYFPSASDPIGNADHLRAWIARESAPDSLFSLGGVQIESSAPLSRTELANVGKSSAKSAVDLLLSRLNAPSRGCRLIQSAILDGKAKGYIGQELGNGSHPEGSGGNRPEGSGGNRPEGSGGNRPEGSGGNRPTDGSSARPAVPLTPCIQVEGL